MKIGIIGTGNIGASLVRKLSAAGHRVTVANSRGPETIEAELLTSGAVAGTAEEAAKDVDVLVLSVPLSAIPKLAPLVASLPERTTVVDTSNFYPQRDGEGFVPADTVESVWVGEQLGRPVVKAWNCIGSASLASNGRPSGDPERLALPVAADREEDKKVAMELVEATGFTAHDAGTLAESWRQQPGTPCYGTDLSIDALPAALERADRENAPIRRDLVVQVFANWLGVGANPDAEWSLGIARSICGGPDLRV